MSPLQAPNGSRRYIAASLALLIAIGTVVGMIWAAVLRPQVMAIAHDEAEQHELEMWQRHEGDIQRVIEGQRRIEAKVDALQQYLLEHPR